MISVYILLIILSIITGISIALAISLSIDKRKLKRENERMFTELHGSKRDAKMLADRERNLNLEVFRLQKKLKRGNRI